MLVFDHLDIEDRLPCTGRFVPHVAFLFSCFYRAPPQFLSHRPVLSMADAKREMNQRARREATQEAARVARAARLGKTHSRPAVNDR